MEIIMVLMGMKVVLINIMVTLVWSCLAAVPIVVGLILILPMPTKRTGRNH